MDKENEAPCRWRERWYGLPLASLSVLVMLGTGLRLVLWREFAGAVPMTGWDRVRVVLTGLQCDVAVALVVTLPLAVWCALRREAWEGTRARRALIGLAVAAWFGQLFLFVSEYFFFAEFLSRFNTVAIDYLIYPTEVTTNLWESYPLVRLVFAALLAGAGLAWFSFRWVPPRVAPGGVGWRRALAWFGAAALAVASLRPGWLRIGSERIVNELASNGAVSGVMAAWSRNLPYDAFYAVTGPREAVRRARSALGGEGVEFPHAEPPELPAGVKPDAAWLEAARKSLIRRIPGDAARPRLNVCVILEESLGSEFWGSLGATNRAGEPISMTRKMDRLAMEEGLLFENLWADGNRTIRGFEGVFSGFPPLPGDSILARDRTENVETIARVLQRDGYRSLFLYGGRGTFDFIRSYTTRNGWDRLIEQGDFVTPAHTTAWGVSDEDIFHRGIEEMRTLHAAGQPFLVSFMTVSNHRPYTFPAGRIKDAANPSDRRPAVRYADWALGDFFRLAKKEAFWKDTVFVVVADHGARVYGSQQIPLPSYRIPMVVLGPAVVPAARRIGELGCQLDVAPTVLGLMGRPYEGLFFGSDLLRAGRPRRVLMHHNRSVGIYRDERMAVFGLNRSVAWYRGDPRSGTMEPMEAPDEVVRGITEEGMALFQTADLLYMNRLFRLGP
jgi:phosphoglycerol transferase MdoB-like AlkP superfamily enzyme